MILGEHFAVPHLGSGGHRLLSIARHNPAVNQRYLEAVECGEVGGDTRCGVPWRIISVGFVFVFLRRGHLDGCFLAEIVQHCEDRRVAEPDILLLEGGKRVVAHGVQY